MYIFVNLVEVTFLSHDSSEKSHPRCIDNPKLYGKPQNEKKKMLCSVGRKRIKTIKSIQFTFLDAKFCKTRT